MTLCHNFDYLRWLFGDGMVHSSLLGYGGLNLEVEDSAEISLVFDEELMGSLHLSFNQRPSKHTLEIIGTGGTINWDFYQNTVSLFEFDETECINQESYVCPDGFDRNDLFVQEMNHFRDVVEGKEKPRCTLDEGIKALNMALKAKERGLK